jgi:phage baseplate assembly protein gpV
MALVSAPGGVTIQSPVTTIIGSMQVTGDVVAGGISLRGHVHGGVRAGANATWTPS